MVRKIKESEIDIQNTICAYLHAKNYLFWRNNTAPSVYRKDGAMQFRRMGKYALSGVPDIIIVYKGHFIGLEVKTKTGAQSDVQREFEKRCNAAGGHYHLVRSLDDVIALEF